MIDFACVHAERERDGEGAGKRNARAHGAPGTCGEARIVRDTKERDNGKERQEEVNIGSIAMMGGTRPPSWAQEGTTHLTCKAEP